MSVGPSDDDSVPKTIRGCNCPQNGLATSRWTSLRNIRLLNQPLVNTILDGGANLLWLPS